MEAVLEGVVLKGVGGNYDVFTEGEIVRCRAGGRVKKASGILACGDYVTLKRSSGGGGYILSRRERRNALIRPAIANIDQLVILCSEAPPVTDPYLVDKVTVVALYQDIRPLIVLNKTDLSPSEGLFRAYTLAGFPVVRVSAVTGEGLDELREHLKDRISAFTGNSAIGKSSLLNALDGRFGLRVGELSEKIGRGKNTTRHVELFSLESGGFVADTPGFSTFDAVRMETLSADTLQRYFPEIDRHFGQCRFSDCRHRKEPDCSVREAVERGEIARSRYESYCALLDEILRQNPWK